MTPRKILIVDDDQKIRSLLKTYLEKNQYEVLLAHDGASFMAEFERHRDEISLCILDVMLPDTEGFTLCQSVRRRSEVPVIMLTASADETDRIVGLELGADDYLGKPFNPRELLARIKAITRRTGQATTRSTASRWTCWSAASSTPTARPRPCRAWTSSC
jgi:DNA-binding response OmpR family regulator